MEVSEEGGVRLWLQTESLSGSAELRLIFNDREISSTPVRTTEQAYPVTLPLRIYEPVTLRVLPHRLGSTAIELVRDCILYQTFSTFCNLKGMLAS